MSETRPETTTRPPDDEPIPLLQRLYDNIWLLFIASMVVTMGFYLVWGMLDLMLLPAAR